MEALGKLFGSVAKVKIMRLFLSNDDSAFDSQDVSKRTKTNLATAKKELSNLKKSGLIKQKTFFKEVEKKKGKKKVSTKKKTQGWALNPKFSYLEPLRSLLVRINSIKHSDILKKLNKAGKVQVVIVSGVFIQEYENRVDILIVGDRLRDTVVESVIKDIESELGKELRYSVFDTEDFRYRMEIYDKLVRDILDFPHVVVLDRMGINY